MTASVIEVVSGRVIKMRNSESRRKDNLTSGVRIRIMTQFLGKYLGEAERWFKGPYEGIPLRLYVKLFLGLGGLIALSVALSMNAQIIIGRSPSIWRPLVISIGVFAFLDVLFYGTTIYKRLRSKNSERDTPARKEHG